MVGRSARGNEGTRPPSRRDKSRTVAKVPRLTAPETPYRTAQILRVKQAPKLPHATNWISVGVIAVNDGQCFFKDAHEKMQVFREFKAFAHPGVLLRCPALARFDKTA